MKTIASTTHNISAQDLKALNHYLIVSPKQWIRGALNWMIDKAITNIKRDYLDIYKSKNSTIPKSDEALINGILALDEFKPYNFESPEKRVPKRKQAVSLDVLDGGFEIEDYEERALKAYWKNPETTLLALFENKIALRKAAFYRDNINVLQKDESVTDIPSGDDDFIDVVTARPDYKTRAQIEEENPV